MAGKSKQARKKQAQTRKREQELLNQKNNKIKKVVASQHIDVVGEEKTCMSKMAQQLPEDKKPFDPQSLIANILKKKEE